STGNMAGIAIMTPLETYLINWLGWQQTLTAIGVILTVVIIPAALFIMKDEAPEGADRGSAIPEDISRTDKKLTLPDVSWKDAIKSRAYWQVVASFFVCGFSMNLMGTNAVPMLMDHGFEPTTASYGIGIVGLVAIVGTFFMGNFADRYPRKNILALIYLVRGLGFLGLVVAVTHWQLYLVAATAGLVWGGSAAMSSAILSDLYGTRLLGVLYGWAYFGHQVGGAIASFLGGWGYEKFGTHLFAYGLTTVLLIGAATVSYQLPSQGIAAKVLLSTRPSLSSAGGDTQG
ncbi:MAG TPA: MFS transporter, partial [Verrucomicrobiae bacterium]|nr:MFS transporter [Verrucomicrobiae bacterium]